MRSAIKGGTLMWYFPGIDECIPVNHIVRIALRTSQRHQAEHNARPRVYLYLTDGQQIKLVGEDAECLADYLLDAREDAAELDERTSK